MARLDGRAYDELRPLTITPDYTKYAEGSVLIRQGDTVIVISIAENRIKRLNDIFPR